MRQKRKEKEEEVSNKKLQVLFPCRKSGIHILVT